MPRNFKIILTVPKATKFGEVAKHPLVEAVRVNTNIPIESGETPESILQQVREEAGGKDVWVDLKCRQLRIEKYDVKILHDREIHYLMLNHRIKLKIPAEVSLDNGKYLAKIIQLVNGNTIVVEGSSFKREGLQLPGLGEVGTRPGMSVTILDPSLEVEKYLTDRDIVFVDAARKLGMYNYMLSFVESASDLEELLKLNPDSRIIAKIESQKGMEFVDKDYSKHQAVTSLMAARGDLWLQIKNPGELIGACDRIIKADKNAVFASRMLESLMQSGTPNCHDIFDVYCGMLLRYKRFMPGDDVCRQKYSAEDAIKTIDALAQKYREIRKWTFFT